MGLNVDLLFVASKWHHVRQVSVWFFMTLDGIAWGNDG